MASGHLGDCGQLARATTTLEFRSLSVPRACHVMSALVPAVRAGAASVGLRLGS